MPLPSPVDLASLPKQSVSFIVPMECTPVAEMPDDAAAWLYELKLDGWRCIAVKRPGFAAIYSRYGTDLSGRFPAIRSAVARLRAPACVLDGELVALDAEGRPIFQELQNHRNTRFPIFLYVFDVLVWKGRGLGHLPLETRKALLASASRAFRDPIRHAPTFDVPLKRLIREIRTRRLEGLVAKRRTSIYRPGQRSPDWLKHRFNQVEEFVVGGYIPGFPAAFRLIVGKERNGRLEYVSSIRNGFSGDMRAQVAEALHGLTQAGCPFVNLPERGPGPHILNAEKMKQCIWVAPRVTAEVEFVNWTEDGRLRHALFRRLLPPVEGPRGR